MVKKNTKIFETIYKNGQKIIKFGDTEIENHKFYQHKNPIPIKNIDINKIVVSNKVSFSKNGFKDFTGYKDGKKIRPKICAYRRDFDETKYVSFLIRNDKLLKKYNELREKVSNSIKIGFDSTFIR